MPLRTLKGAAAYLAPQTKTLIKTVSHCFVKALFLFDGSAFVECQLDEHTISGSLDTEIRRIKYKAFGRMFGDYLEMIVFRYLEVFDHCFVDYSTDGFSVIRRPALDEVNSNERHK